MNAVPSFDTLADDLVSRVAQKVGPSLLSGWQERVRSELSADSRGVRYIRYLCEMMVMLRDPEIHHLTIERKSCLKNFQTSVSGVLVGAGLVRATDIFHQVGQTHANSQANVVTIGIIGLGIGLFWSLRYKERDLRISIWRAFHAMDLIAEKQPSTNSSVTDSVDHQ